MTITPDPSWTPENWPAQPVPPVSPENPPAAGVALRRRGWVAIVGTAAAAALVASFATAGLTGAFAAGTSTPTSLTTIGQTDTNHAVPVAGSTLEQPNWEAVAAAVRPSVVAIDVRTSQGAGKGSGVIIDSGGHILTNNHVAGAAADGGIQVTLADGRVFKATVVGSDPTTDLAVITLTDAPSDLTAATMGDSSKVAVGQPVMAVGNPLGLESTVTTGIVSALDRPVSTTDNGDQAVVTNAIQIDAAINPGNSGGPLFDASGTVIGITSSIASLSSGAGQSGSIGLGFAIPSALASRVASELIKDGTAQHAFLGVSLTDGTATADGVTRRGAVVQDVTQGSPASDAGIRAGDVIVAMNRDAVSGAESLTAFVREQAAGANVTLTLVRGGAAQDVKVALAVATEQAQPSSSDQQAPQPRQSQPGGGAWPWDHLNQG